MSASSRTTFSLSWRALLIGLGTGIALVLLVVVVYRTTVPTPESLGASLIQVFLIYFPTGFVTGLQVRKAERRDLKAHKSARRGPAPPALHALVVGVLLTLVHALVFLANNAGSAGRLNAFLVEAVLAALIAAVGGAFGGFFRSGSRS